MIGWPETKLKELCAKVTVGYVGPMAHAYQTSGIPFLRSQNIKPGRIDFQDLKFIDANFHAKISKSALHPGDVAVVRTGYPGTAAVVPKSLPVSNCSDLVIVRPGKALNPHFVAAIFNSTFGQTLVSGNTVGAAQQHFNITVAKELKLRIPAKPVQDKIAAVLAAYDDLIEANRRRIALLERMAEEIYREWFVRLRFPGHEKTRIIKGLPAGWDVRPLGSVVAEIKHGIRQRDLSAEQRYIGLEHIPRRSIALRDWSTADTVESNKLKFQPRDILFSKIRPYLHKVALAHFAGVCSSDTIVLRPKDRIHEGFVLFTVFSETFIELATIASKGTKMPRADWGFLQKLNLAIPSPELAARFQEHFDAHFSQIVTLLRANELLQRTRDLLRPRLISGKLAVEHLAIAFPPGMAEAANG